MLKWIFILKYKKGENGKFIILDTTIDGTRLTYINKRTVLMYNYTRYTTETKMLGFQNRFIHPINRRPKDVSPL